MEVDASGVLNSTKLWNRQGHPLRFITPGHLPPVRSRAHLSWLRAHQLSMFASADGALGVLTHLDGEATALLRALEYNLAHFSQGTSMVGAKSYAQYVRNLFIFAFFFLGEATASRACLYDVEIFDLVAG